MLNDGVSVLSRMMSTGHCTTGIKLRFSDQRKKSKSLSFQIFHAKKPVKDAPDPNLPTCVSTTLKQLERAITKICLETTMPEKSQSWIQEAEHYRSLLLQVVDQTQRCVFNNEKVPASEKPVALFLPVLDACEKDYGNVPIETVANGGYVSIENVEQGRGKGVSRTVFNKRCGLSYHRWE